MSYSEDHLIPINENHQSCAISRLHSIAEENRTTQLASNIIDGREQNTYQPTHPDK